LDFKNFATTYTRKVKATKLAYSEAYLFIIN